MERDMTQRVGLTVLASARSGLRLDAPVAAGDGTGIRYLPCLVRARTTVDERQFAVRSPSPRRPWTPARGTAWPGAEWSTLTRQYAVAPYGECA
jgi:hypothetical protein